MSYTCKVDKQANHATIRFGSSSHNALSFALLEELINSIQNLDHDDSIKILLIKSEGEKTFCAGADLKELLALDHIDHATRYFYGFARLILAIRNSPHMIITAVQGKAVGGGLGMIAASDYAIGVERAQVRLSELINGIGPFVIGPALERKIGLAAFNHMTLNPSIWFDSDWSKNHGLYNEVTTDLNYRVEEKINEFSRYSSKALRDIKKMMWQNTPSWVDLLRSRAETSGRLIMTEESKEALKNLKG
jgi:methylglutaconyl-CoA hydratase